MMSNFSEKLAILTEKVSKLESSSLVLSEALHYGDNSIESYSGAMDLLHEGMLELSELCADLSNNCN